MSRRKQARPIRVLESEEGLNNLSVLDLTNGGGSSGGENNSVADSVSESEDEDANNKAKVIENLTVDNSTVQDTVYERLKTVSGFDMFPKLAVLNKKHSTFPSVNEDQTDNEDSIPIVNTPLYENFELPGLPQDEDSDEDEVFSNNNEENEEEVLDELQKQNDSDEKLLNLKEKSDDENDNNNNNNVENYDEHETDSENESQENINSDITSVPYLPTSHVTLEALKNTQVAVAQFAASALANNNNPAALHGLAEMQNALYTLQRTQLAQINLIQRLQNELKVTRSAKSSTRSSSPVFLQSESETNNISTADNDNDNVPLPLVVARPSSPSSSILTPPKPSRTPTPTKQEISSMSVSPSNPQPLISYNKEQVSKSTSPPSCSTQINATLPPCSISSSFASSIITNLDPPPSPSEPNTLEMLQKRAQEVLDNASQGLLANNLADELAFRKNGSNGKGSSLSPYDSKTGGRNEPFFKHRCRYCGKVFGSDSALQIHIRSHTGERPFQCNVCGSRFTTKGNLKVHFQRHTSKYPNIKMNPNPVPEHLDKYHPPLLAQLNNHQSISPGIPPPPHPSHATIPLSSPSINLNFPNNLSHLCRSSHPSSHDLSLHRLPHESTLKPFVPFPFFGNQISEQEQPENLCKPASSQHSYSPPLATSETNDQCKKDLIQDEEMQDMSETSETANEYQNITTDDNTDNITDNYKSNSNDDCRNNANILKSTDIQDSDILPKSVDHDSENEAIDQERCHSPYGECSIDSKYSNEEQEYPECENISTNNITGHSEESLQEQPENLSNKSRSEINDLSLDSRRCYSQSPYPSPRLLSPASSISSDSFDRYSSCTPLPFSNDSDPSKDPFLYTNFLPRPGSTDNSWENLIEINKTSETSKLQELVDNIGHKLTDPNECIVCHRILSCKSALQMHYRTHTGERPFRCKICGRSFTTKGNLKTHMGVHRIKPPVRVHHQCPVCHKRFTNSLILQQHIRLHTGEPTDLTPEQIQASEIKEYFPQLNANHLNNPASFIFSKHLSSQHMPSVNSVSNNLPSSSQPPSVLDNNNKETTDFSCNTDKESIATVSDKLEDIKTRLTSDMPSEDRSNLLPVFTTSLAALENHVKTVTTMSSHMAMVTMTQSFVNLCSKFSGASHNELNDEKSSDYRRTDNSPIFGEQLSPNSKGSISPAISNMDDDDDDDSSAVNISVANVTNSLSTPLDLTPKSSSVSPSTTATLTPGNMYSNNGTAYCFTSSSSAITSNNSTSPLISSVLTAPFNPLGLAVASSVRGNTTCNICYKTFACNSALEIHYRSHTKERPFKCTVCDRGFSTKGNMKQHMLTHKIRDMPSHLFEKTSPGSVSIPSSLVDETSNTSTESKDPLQAVVTTGLRCVPIETLTTTLHKGIIPTLPSLPTPVSEPVVIPLQKRSSPDNDSSLPVPIKRQSNLPKHLCTVCNKNFSSSSALQIHMRTHTGDKPFKCSVCRKAFTTKGNLKVHMGTHLYTNGASRRGRRMSLELPSLPIAGKDAQPELFHRRPDFFYPPYLPSFLNGVHQKLNEISLQNVSGSLTNGFFPFGAYGSLGELKRPSSPVSPSLPPLSRHLNSDSHPTPSPWDLHFERKTVDDRVDACTPSPPHQSQHQPHGKGLAA